MIIILLFNSCKDKNIYYYPQDEKVSNKRGITSYSNINWIPKFIRKDTGLVYTGIDTSKTYWSLNIWKLLREPILYNFYLGYDCYRFIWARSFKRLIILTLIRQNSNVYLTCKTIQDNDSLIKNNYKQELLDAIRENREQYLQKEEWDNGALEIDSIFKLNNIKNVVYFKPRTLTLDEWNEFENILKAANFWNNLPYDQYSGLDGSRWTIEAHLKDRYWFNSKWSPNASFRKPGNYLIQKSGLNEDVY